MLGWKTRSSELKTKERHGVLSGRLKDGDNIHQTAKSVACDEPGMFMKTHISRTE